jgi:hypothetical protein
VEKTISLWLNSTLGAIQLLRTRTETRGPWIGFKKPNLDSLSILDPTALSGNQIQEFVRLFETVSLKPLLSLSEMPKDKTRHFIDSEISRILKLPDCGVLRELLASEPILSL